MNYNQFRICHGSTKMTSSCGMCGKPTDGKPWHVFVNSAALCGTCAKKHAPILAAVAKLIDQKGDDLDQRHYAVRLSREVTSGGHVVCPETKAVFLPREIEVCYRGAGKLLSPRAGEDLAPSLAAAVYKFLGTEPEPRPVPPPPPPPPETPAERAARRHAATVAAISAALGIPAERADVLVNEIRSLAD
jgi:hypothetical protein